MAHFTQLGLSGNPEGKASKNNSRAEHRLRSNQNKFNKAAVFITSIVAVSLLGIFLMTSGCSRGGNKSASITAPEAVSQPTPVSRVTLPSSDVLSAAPVVKKPKPRQHKLSAATYSNPAYGVSFRYPKRDALKQGDKANLQWDGLGPVQMNFVQPGGTTVSAVELPPNSYKGTDLASAFFTLSVNPKLTAEECARFAFPDSSQTEGDASQPSTIPPAKLKVGVTEFNATETLGGEDTKQADAKYYHVFQNGNCYEFMLGVETASDDETGKVKPVDRNEVFRKLNWILSTVKINPVQTPKELVPEVTAETPSAAEQASKE